MRTMISKVIIAILLIVSCVAFADTWADPDTGYTWTYRINDDGAEIYNDYDVAISPLPAGDVTIPATLGGKTVTRIGSCAFFLCSNLTSVVIPDGVMSIGDHAFEDCDGLTNIVIPASVVSIEGQAFASCSGLSSVIIPDSVNGLGFGAFGHCSGLTNLTIGSGVHYLEQDVFCGCSGLTSVTIPDGVREIGSWAFAECSGLTNVVIPATVTFIGEGAFGCCGKLESIDVESGNVTYKTDSGLLLTADGESLVAVPGGFSSVAIPDSITNIGGGAFAGCSELTSITLPLGVTNIGSSAFSGCDKLTSLTIPDGVKSIEGGSFGHCSSLTNVNIPDGVTRIGNSAFYGCSSLTNVIIPTSVTSIGSWAFEGCNSAIFDTKTIPDVKLVDGWVVDYLAEFSGDLDLSGVRGVGNGAFSGCRRLTSVTIPANMTSIAPHMFSDCSGLTSVTISDSVTTIGYGAFYGCSSLTNVIIPTSVTSVGSGAFSGCNTALFDTKTMPGVKLVDGWAVGFVDEPLENLDFTGVRGIVCNAFAHCNGVNNVVISESVKSIGDDVFRGCNGLTSVIIFGGGTSVGDRAFAECNDLRSVTISGGETSIGESAFVHCGLTNVVIAGTVTSIGSCAFRANYHLCSVVFLGRRPLYASEYAFDDYAYDGHYSWLPFVFHVSRYADGWSEVLATGAWNGHPVEYMDLGEDFPPFTYTVNPDGTVTLLSYAGAAVPEIIVIEQIDGKSISAISSRAFSTCAGLQKVTIPATVRWLDDEAFSGCSSLSAVTYLGDAPDTGDNIYKGTPRSLVSYVRGGSIGWAGGVSVIIPETWNDRRVSCEWTVELDVQGGVIDGSGSLNVTNGCSIGVLPVAMRNGYVFEGWFTMPEGGERVDDTMIVTGPLELYAQWTLTHYLVTFDENGGMLNETNRLIFVNSEIGDLPIATRNGYMLLGWFTEASGGDKIDASIIIESDVTFYAHWLSSREILFELAESYNTESNGSFDLVLSNLVLSVSIPKITVKGLPTGLKFDAKTGVISGKATKPGVYEVTVSATNATVKKPVTKTFELVVPNLASEKLPGLEQDTEAYGKIVCGVAFDPGLVDCAPEDGWTLKAAGLPAGLKLVQDKNTKAYSITGVPTKAGTYTVTFTASKKGEKNQVATITLNVEALPTWAVGTFAGRVSAVSSKPPYQEYGSASMTVAANGKISGKIALLGTNWTFSATSFGRVESGNGELGTGNGGATFVVNAVAKAGKATMPVVLEVRDSQLEASGGDGGGAVATQKFSNGVAVGEIGDGEATLWRNMWKDKATAVTAKAELAKWEGLYTLSLEDGGYLSLTIGKDGSVKASGKLSDGTKVSATSPLVYDEEYGWLAYFYTAPSAYKGGSFAIAVGFDGPHGASGGLIEAALPVGPARWTSRNPQATGAYGEGFDRTLDFFGAYYGKKPDVSAWSSAKFDVESPDGYSFDGVAPKVSVAQATGIFKGSCSFLPDGGGKAKKVNFEGIVVLGAESMQGFYLWDAVGAYVDPKTGKPKTYKYKESHQVELR